MKCEKCKVELQQCWEVFPIEFPGKKGWKVADETRHKFFRLKKNAEKFCTKIKKAGDDPALMQAYIHPGKHKIIGGPRKSLNYKDPPNIPKGADISKGKYAGWWIGNDKNHRPFTKEEYELSWLKKTMKRSYKDYLSGYCHYQKKVK